MKSTVSMSLAAGAAALLLAGCGGGGGGGNDNDEAAPAQTLQISGTAATGMALANMPVAAQCATGSGTATTSATGEYSISISGGIPPCMMEVSTGESAYHSLVVAAANGNAVANITPVTEIILASATGIAPSYMFADMKNHMASLEQIHLEQASNTVVQALKASIGVDFASFNPFTSKLEARTPATEGNDHDRLLDALGEKIPAVHLPGLVIGIADASRGGGNYALSMLDLLKAADTSAALQDCPSAKSGKYRTVDYVGRARVYNIDFKAGKIIGADGVTPVFDITRSTEQACEFTAQGIYTDNSNPQNSTTQVSMTVAMSSSGAGAYVRKNEVNSTSGFIFPLQTQPLSALEGSWTAVQSVSFLPADSRNGIGMLKIDGKGNAAVCGDDYRKTGLCGDSAFKTSITVGQDGVFEMNDGEDKRPLYVYRSPSGGMALFAPPTNAQGSVQEHFFATRLENATLPNVGEVSKYWDVTINTKGQFLDAGITADANTVTALQSDIGTYSRERLSDARRDTVKINDPVQGVRTRSLDGTPEAYQIPLSGLGITTLFDIDQTYFTISVGRP